MYRGVGFDQSVTAPDRLMEFCECFDAIPVSLPLSSVSLAHHIATIGAKGNLPFWVGMHEWPSRSTAGRSGSVVTLHLLDGVALN